MCDLNPTNTFQRFPGPEQRNLGIFGTCREILGQTPHKSGGPVPKNSLSQNSEFIKVSPNSSCGHGTPQLFQKMASHFQNTVATSKFLFRETKLKHASFHLPFFRFRVPENQIQKQRVAELIFRNPKTVCSHTLSVVISGYLWKHNKHNILVMIRSSLR